MSGHRFLGALTAGLSSGLRQFLLHGQVEDQYYLSDLVQMNSMERFLGLRETLCWYFLNQDHGSQHTIMLIFSTERRRGEGGPLNYRPPFADEQLDPPYPGGTWPTIEGRMAGAWRELIGPENLSILSFADWLALTRRLLSQDKYRVVLLLENAEGYWHRPDLDQQNHNLIDGYLAVFRGLLQREGCIHRVLLTSSLQDASGFKIGTEQIGIIPIGLPTVGEAEELFLGAGSLPGDREALTRRFREIPARRTLEIERRHLDGPKGSGYLTPRRFDQALRGEGPDDPWCAALGDLQPADLGAGLRGQAAAVAALGRFWGEVRDEVGFRQATGRSRRRLLGFRLLAGPTGVGKTEYFRQVGERLARHGIGSRIFNCTEYLQEHAFLRLVGSPPSYVGSQTGELGQYLLETPYSVILFDEWEKAHIQIQRAFLKVLEGELTLGSGQRVDLSNTLIFFTSNAGAALLSPAAPDEGPQERQRRDETNLGHVLAALRSAGMPPELEGRLRASIVVFDHLSDAVAEEIIKDQLRRAAADVGAREPSVRIEWHPSVADHLLNRFQLQRRSGARALRDAVEAIKGDLVGALGSVSEDRALAVWCDADGRTCWDTLIAAPYVREDLSDLWAYALGRSFADAKGGSPFERECDRLVGQGHAKQAVTDYLRGRRATRRLGAPMFLLFGGPTGVGKTELFHRLGDLFARFHVAKGPVFAMTEHTREGDLAKLIGSPPGFEGTHRGYLGEFLLNHPTCTLCFDEFEKCHPDIRLLFLKILEGELMLGSGERVDLSGVFFIFTTNAGGTELDAALPGDGQRKEAAIRRNADLIADALRRDHRVPDELIGRIRVNLIPFMRLTRDEAQEIIERRLKDHEGRCTFDDSVRDSLLDGYLRQPRYGARDLVQGIAERIGPAVARLPAAAGGLPVLWADRDGLLRSEAPIPEEQRYVRRPLFSAAEERRIAVHEAGHAVCTAALFGPEAVEDIAVDTEAPLGSVPGVTRAGLGSAVLTRELLLDQVAVLLAGRAAERLYYGDNGSAGCAQDLAEANRRVRSMVCDWGMVRAGLVPIHAETLGGLVPDAYVAEMLALLGEAERRVDEVLTARRGVLDALVGRLAPRDGESAAGRGYVARKALIELWRDCERDAAHPPDH